MQVYKNCATATSESSSTCFSINFVIPYVWNQIKKEIKKKEKKEKERKEKEERRRRKKKKKEEKEEKKKKATDPNLLWL